MKVFDFKYLCRNCGSKYTGKRMNNDLIAREVFMCCIYDDMIEDEETGVSGRRLHKCNNQELGIADLVGLEEKEM